MAFAVAGVLAGMVGLSGGAFGKGKPTTPGEEEAGNNLSTPGVLMESQVPILASWLPPNAATLGVHYSYGCAGEEKSADGKFTYPNTSCVDDLASPTIYYTAEECTDTIQPSPCQGLDVLRMYWQKVAVNDWSGDVEGGLTVPATPRSVGYNNWGDALEAVSWSETSQVRVENQPYESLIPGFDPIATTCEGAATTAGLDPADVCKVGIKMWHVSGQGITEQWGAVATDSDPAVSYNYDSPFQIINTGTARLNIAKMAPETATCAAPGEGGVVPPPPTLGDWNGSGWEGGACTWRDATFAVELSVSGKYVYGYNWPLKTVELLTNCGTGWLKSGWWRLTFYTDGGDPTDHSDDPVQFLDGTAPVTAPPDVPSAARVLPRAEYIADVVIPGEPGESEVLYTPVIDIANNLTYIDVCVTTAKGGGGGGGKGGGGGGKGKPTN
jgi:hypothetical protein